MFCSSTTLDKTSVRELQAHHLLQLTLTCGAPSIVAALRILSYSVLHSRTSEPSARESAVGCNRLGMPSIEACHIGNSNPSSPWVEWLFAFRVLGQTRRRDLGPSRITYKKQRHPYQHSVTAPLQHIYCKRQATRRDRALLLLTCVVQFPMPYILPHDAHSAAPEKALDASTLSHAGAPTASTSSDAQRVPFPHTSEPPRSHEAHAHRHWRSVTLKSCLKPQTRQNSPRRAQSSPSAPKLVHYPSLDVDLRSVRVFKLMAKPLAISKPEEETETETEGYDSSSAAYQLPRAASYAEETYTIDVGQSSPVPARNPATHANVYLETVQLPAILPLTLRGSALVRNIAFQKTLVVRFSMDNWTTTSEVNATYVSSASSIPPPFHDPDGSAWDRFSFQINLSDKLLAGRTLLLAVHYEAAGGDWWDNNDGADYTLSFVPIAKPSQDRLTPRRIAGDAIPRTASPLGIDAALPDAAPDASRLRLYSAEVPRASPAASKFHTPLRGWTHRSQGLFPPAPTSKHAYFGHGTTASSFGAGGAAFPKTLSVL